MKKLNFLFVTIIALGSYSASYGQYRQTEYGDNAGNNGDYGSYFGYGAGRYTSGGFNSFFGSYAGYANTTGTRNTFVGAFSGRWNTSGSNNTLLGHYSGVVNTTGYENVFTGTYSGKKNTTGYRNVFLGYNSGLANTSGNRNVFLGHTSGGQNTSGYGNIYIGTYSGGQNKTGNRNSYLGYHAGYLNQVGSYNVCLGNEAGYNETGSNKLFIANNRNNHLIYGDFATNQIGINTKDLGTHTLSVNGTARAKEILVEEGWGDYVFLSDYQLLTLDQEAQHIQEKGHLSGFQSAEEMNGEIQLGDVTKRQQVKIEEMMLHMIAMKKEIEALKAELSTVKK